MKFSPDEKHISLKAQDQTTYILKVVDVVAKAETHHITDGWGAGFSADSLSFVVTTTSMDFYNTVSTVHLYHKFTSGGAYTVTSTFVATTDKMLSVFFDEDVSNYFTIVGYTFGSPFNTIVTSFAITNSFTSLNLVRVYTAPEFGWIRDVQGAHFVGGTDLKTVVGSLATGAFLAEFTHANEAFHNAQFTEGGVLSCHGPHCDMHHKADFAGSLVHHDAAVALTRACAAETSRECLFEVVLDVAVLSVAFSPDGKEMAVGAEDGVVRVMEAATGHQLRTLSCVNFAANDLAFSPDGKRIAVVGTETVICNARTGMLLVRSQATEAAAQRVRWSPDGAYIVVGGGAQSVLRVFSADTGAVSLSQSGVNTVDAFISASNQVTVMESQTPMLSVFTIATGAMHPEACTRGNAQVITAAGSTLAYGMKDGTFYISNNGAAAVQKRLPRGMLHDVALSTDGYTVAAAGAMTTQVLDVSGVVLATLYGHSQAVFRVAFSPVDSQHLATAGQDGRLLVWNVGASPL